jgi:hypothetical protein
MKKQPNAQPLPATSTPPMGFNRISADFAETVRKSDFNVAIPPTIGRNLIASVKSPRICL